MPVALPAVLEPQQGALTEVRAQGAEHAVLRLATLRIHLLGPQVLDAAAAQRSIEGKSNPSDAVRALAVAHYAAGYPAAQLRYALDGEDLYVLVVLGEVVRVDMPAPLRKYFASLPAGPLTDDAFEPRRALASIHADRAGLNAEPIFLAQPAGGFALDMKPDDGGPRQFSFRTGFNNQGNRFVGRYFSETNGRVSLKSGDEFMLGWRTALPGIDDDSRAQNYDEYSAGWSRVTTRGIFGLSARQSEFRFRLFANGVPIPADSEFRQVELAWLFPLAASIHRRWTVNASLDYSFLERSALSGDAVLQDQELAALQVGHAYAYIWRWTERVLNAEAGVQIRHGLSDDRTDDPQTRADLGYWLVRPNLNAGLAIGDAWNLSFELRAQFSGDTLPEDSQWVLGGVQSLHAWLPGVAVGDSGALGRVQADYLDWEFKGLRIVPGVFVEYGYARFDAPELTASPRGNVSLGDAGAQIGLEIGRWVKANVSSALILDKSGQPDAVFDAAEADVLFEITARF